MRHLKSVMRHACTVLWFLGHAVTFLLGASYILYSRFFSYGSKHYTKALWGTILSYGIIIYKAHGVPQVSRAYMQRIMMDENMHYLMLSFIWATSKPVWVVLIPFVTFSFFHSLNYTRTELLPRVVPATSPFHATVTQTISPALLNLTQRYQSQALEWIAYLEVWVIPPYLIVSVLFGGAGLLTPLLFFFFMRFRYFFSALTRKAVADLKTRGDALVARPGVPEWVRAVYGKAVNLIREWGDVTAQVGQQPGAGPARNPNMAQTR
ncbi:hypothetical protein HDU96_007826 [Phlyctochytrium bullatum]|nr:hypothetical protein HDU96_007826 [Phlyctochytrium bullatum]